MTSTNTTKSRNHTRMLAAEGLNWSSGGLQVPGNAGTDHYPEILFAVAVAHAGNATDALIAEVEDLRNEVSQLRRR